MDAPGEDDIEIIQVNGLPFRKPKALPRAVAKSVPEKKYKAQPASTTQYFSSIPLGPVDYILYW